MSVNEPDFHQLKKLWTVKQIVETGSLKQAASRGRVTISAISQTVTALEKTMGRKLFVRKDRRLFPTTFCREVLAAVDPAFQSVSDLQNFQAGTCEIPKMAWLDFGVSDCIAGAIVPNFVRRMNEVLPEMKLTLRVGKCRELTKLVKNGELCMAIVADDGFSSGTSIYPIAEERFGLFTSAQHRSVPQFRETKSPFAALLPGPDGHSSSYTKVLNRAQKSYRRGLSSDSYETLFAIAASGTMPAILPARLATRTAGLLEEIPLSAHETEAKPLGHFKLSMVSQKVCDPAEDQFLISELKSLL